MIPVDTPATIDATFYPAGDDTGANDGTVTVAVTRADGTTVDGIGAVSVGTEGRYTATLPAQEQMDILTATWTGNTAKVRTIHEIVGANLVELAEIRAQTNLTSDSIHPTALLDDARSWFLDLVDDYCGFSPVPRFTQETVDGTGYSRVVIPNKAYVRTIRYITVDGVAVDDLAAWDLDEGILCGPATLTKGRRNIVIGYEHGLDQAPADLRRAALTAIRARVLADTSKQLPDRVLSQTNEFGAVQYAQASKRYPTGLPEVDAVLARYRLPSLA